jgi:hypothetical protein
MFTKQHFVAMAEFIEGMDRWHIDIKREIAVEMANMFANDNSRFNTAKFLKAAGVERCDDCKYFVDEESPICKVCVDHNKWEASE